MKDFLRLMVSLSILIIGIFSVIILTMPYTKVPAQMVWELSEHNRFLGMVLSALVLVGIVWFANQFHVIMDKILFGIYNTVSRVF